MIATFRKSFARDLKKLKDEDVRERVREVIEDVEKAAELAEIGQMKKMAGTDNHFRIRIGNYRIGVVVEKGTVEFVRCLPRRDLYKHFP